MTQWWKNKILMKSSFYLQCNGFNAFPGQKIKSAHKAHVSRSISIGAETFLKAYLSKD